MKTTTLRLCILGLLCWAVQAQAVHIGPISGEFKASDNESFLYVFHANILSSIDFPPDFDDIDQPSIDCESPYPTPAYIDSTFGSGGFPQGTCDSLQWTYTDSVKNICPGSYELYRLWEISDPCASEIHSHMQTILVLDKTPPMVFCPDPSAATVGPTMHAGNSDCWALVQLPPILTSDNCTPNSEILVYVMVSLPDASLLISNKLNTQGNHEFKVPIRPHPHYYTFTYVGIDNCGNKSFCEVEIAVRDTDPPVVICPGMMEVNATDSITYVNATTFDVGSMDNCSNVQITGRRGTLVNGNFVQHPCNQPGDFTFKPQIRFYCCDIDHTVPLFTELRYRDAYGNDAYCIVPVTVVDKVKPVIWCPKDINVDCDLHHLPPTNYKGDTVVICTQPNIPILNSFPGIYTTFIDPEGIPAGSVITDLDLSMIIDHELTNQLEITLYSPFNKKNKVLPSGSCVGHPVAFPSNINVTFNDQAYDIIVFNQTGQYVPANFYCIVTKPSIGAYNQGHMVPRGPSLQLFNEEAVNAISDNLNFSISDLDIDPLTNNVSNFEIQLFILNAGLTLGDEILIKYEQATGAPIGGLQENTIYLFEVINFNTLRFLTTTGADITDAPAGTFHKFSATNSWMLVVEDVAPLAGGIIKEVCLHITYTPNTGLLPHYIDNTEECGITLSHQDLQVPTACPTNTSIDRQWTVTDNSGNSRSCIQKVYFKDPTDFIVQFPCDVSIECSDHQDLSVTGDVLHNGECEHVNITYTDFLLTPSGEHEKILRTWVVKDDCRFNPDGIPDIVATQFEIPNNTIYFSPNLPTFLTSLNYVPGDRFVIQYFNTSGTPIAGLEIGQRYNVRWMDSTAVRFEQNAITGQPVTLLNQGNGPHVFSYANSDHGIPVNCDQLNKLAPNVNWDLSCCDHGTTYVNDGDGYFSYTQEITLYSPTDPLWANCLPEEFCSYDSNCLAELIEVSLQHLGPCADTTAWIYSWEIDFDQDGNIDVAGTGEQTEGTYPIGVHQIIITATDPQGMINTCTKTFTIKDCVPPSPVCHPAISVIFPAASTGLVTVSAQQFEAGLSADNCTPYNDLELRLQRASGLFPGQQQPSLNATSTLDLSCLDLPPFAPSAEIDVAVWVGDASGNWDFCVSTITLEDHYDVCKGSPAFSQLYVHILDVKEEGISGANIEMSGTVSVSGLKTDYDGKAYLGLAPKDGEYTVTPTKETLPVFGLSTYDMLLIQKHLLGKKPITNPYMLIAADINNSCSVSIADIIALRKVILTPGLQFPNNISWRFVDYDHVFANPAKPCNFPESIYRSPLDMPVTEFKFRGIRIGDINGDSYLMDPLDAETRNETETLYFSMNNAWFTAGVELEVMIRATDFEHIYGYQYSLDFDPEVLSFVALEPVWSFLGEENFGLHNVGSGQITTSWHDGTAQTLNDDEILYRLRFRTLKAGNVQQNVKLNNQLLRAEAYAENDAFYDVQFQFLEDGQLENKFILFQNVPNPYNAHTDIRFYLPEDSGATFKLFDATGICLKTLDGYYSKGYHSVTVQRSELPGSGMYYYQVHTDKQSATKSMILTE